jgi:hypothetical protein
MPAGDPRLSAALLVVARKPAGEAPPVSGTPPPQNEYRTVTP